MVCQPCLRWKEGIIIFLTSVKSHRDSISQTSTAVVDLPSSCTTTMLSSQRSLIALFCLLQLAFSFQLRAIDAAQFSFNLATLEFDSKWKLHVNEQIELRDDLYQICLDENCFNYKKLSSPIAQDLILTVSKDNVIQGVAFFESSQNGLNLLVEQIPLAPTPKLPRKEKKVTKVRTDNKLELKEVVSEEEEEEIVDNRSFIQKYWMYIVPALLIMLVSGNQ